jgi:hypothetical protein
MVRRGNGKGKGALPSLNPILKPQDKAQTEGRLHWTLAKCRTPTLGMRHYGQLLPAFYTYDLHGERQQQRRNF